MYADPEAFEPARFLRDGELDPDVMDPATYIFGFGRRSVSVSQTPSFTY